MTTYPAASATTPRYINNLWWFMSVIFPVSTMVLSYLDAPILLKVGVTMVWLTGFVLCFGLAIKDAIKNPRPLTKFEHFTAWSFLVPAAALLVLPASSVFTAFLATTALIWLFCFILAVLLAAFRIKR